MTRADVSARGLSVDGAAPGWGEFTAARDPLTAAARTFVAGRNRRLARLDRSTLSGLVAAHLALGPGGPGRRSRRGLVVVAVEDGSAAADRAYWRTARERGGADASPSLFAATLPSAAAGEIAMTFGLRCACIVLAGAGSGDAGTAAVRRLAGAGDDGPRLDVLLRGWRGGEDGVAVATSVPERPSPRVGDRRRAEHV